MSAKHLYIPKSERGRRVWRYLREQGFEVRQREVMGKHLCNLDLDLPLSAVRSIAYIVAPFYAALLERVLVLMACDSRKHPSAWGIDPADADSVETACHAVLDKPWVL